MARVGLGPAIGPFRSYHTCSKSPLPSPDLEYLWIQILDNYLQRGPSLGMQSRLYSLAALESAADDGFRTLRSYEMLGPIRVTLIPD